MSKAHLAFIPTLNQRLERGDSRQLAKTILSAGVASWASHRAQTLSSPDYTLNFQDFLSGHFSIRQKIFQSIGGFDTYFTQKGTYGNEDIDLGYRLFNQNYTIVFDADAISWHYFSLTLEQKLHHQYQLGRSDVTFVRKHPEQAQTVFNDAQRRSTTLLGLPPARLYHLSPLVFNPLQALANALLKQGTKDDFFSQPANFCARHLIDICDRVQYSRGVNEAGGIPKAHPVRVLAYHAIADLSSDPILSNFAIPSSEFEKQLDDLARWGFNFITGAELMNFLTGKGGLPRKPILITFDDCYEDLLEVALPILQDRNISPVAFAITGKLGGTNDWDICLGAQALPLLDEAALQQLSVR